MKKLLFTLCLTLSTSALFAQLEATDIFKYVPGAPKLVVTGKMLLEFPPVSECLNTNDNKYCLMSEYNPNLDLFVVDEDWVKQYKENYRTPDYEVLKPGVVVFRKIKSEETLETVYYHWRWLYKEQLQDVKLYPGDERPVIRFIPLRDNVEEEDLKKRELEAEIKRLIGN